MSIAGIAEDIDGEQDLRAVVQEVVAEETADLREELKYERSRRQQAEQALATVHRNQDRNMVSQTVFRRTVNQFADALTDQEISDYTIHPMSNLGHVEGVREDINDLFTTVDEHASALDSMGHGKPEGKADAWQRIVAAAENLEGNAENTVDVDGRYDVVLYWKDIKTATGYSERYCKKLISVFGDEESDDKKRGAKFQPYEPASDKNKGNARRKRLYVDLGVWGSDE